MSELDRKILHVVAGLAIVLVIFLLDEMGMDLLLLLFFVGVLLSLLSRRYRLPLIDAALRRFDRKKETWPGKGAITLLAGSLLVAFLFTREIALAAILTLTLGDGVSHLFGRYVGKRKNPLDEKKMLEGTLMGILAATIGASLFVSFPHALTAAFVGMFVESLQIPIDDNLSVPLAAALILSLL